MKLNKIIFFMFFISGFCSLCYQIIWIRLAFASFGVITPVLSVVLSIFMMGLSIGTWISGKYIIKICNLFKKPAVFFYGIEEILIGIGGLLTPSMFAFGSTLLYRTENMNSFNYLFFSALIIGISIFPWCFFMGATIPSMLAFLKANDENASSGFSFLYFANVVGAMCGTLVTAVVLIEIYGFKNTLLMASFLNFTIGVMSILIGKGTFFKAMQTRITSAANSVFASNKTYSPFFVYVTLFMTGFISMSMEVIWTRAFTPVLNTRTYSFASLLSVYLLATWLGSYLYRKHLKKGKAVSIHALLGLLAVFSFLPITMTDPRLEIGIPSVLFSIFPFSLVLGYFTPKLIDDFSGGDPLEGGKVYAVNAVGCIIGPLFASYALLPSIGVVKSLVTLATPFLAIFILYNQKDIIKNKFILGTCTISFFLLIRSMFVHVSYEEMYENYPGCTVRRDYAANVTSSGENLSKALYVNGIPVTGLTPITKVMAHLPLFYCKSNPKSALVICLGMGTTYRSLLTWDLSVTAVELIPSVKEAFPFYFEDAAANNKGQIIVDDGRRFLNRTAKKFDVITLDPAPPVEAACSSLIYSEEFCEIVKEHLTEGGIFHQWFPSGENNILYAITRSITNVFPYVRTYRSIENWGVHFIASMTPLDNLNIELISKNMPEKAKQDLVEWNQEIPLDRYIKNILSNEIPIEYLLNEDPNITITDDKPYNEYYLLRRVKAKIQKMLKK